MNHTDCDDRNQQDKPDLCYNLYKCVCGQILIEDIYHSKKVWYDSTTGNIHEVVND